MTKNANKEVHGRGRPRKEIKLPKGNKFTISAILAANPEVKCLPTIYKRVAEMVENKTLKSTNERVETGKAGKPASIFWRMSAWNSIRNLQKTKKLAKTPVVELAPVEVPVAEAVAEPVMA
jgi:hypothetical protein